MTRNLLTILAAAALTWAPSVASQPSEPIHVLPSQPDADTLVRFTTTLPGPVLWEFDDGNTSVENPAQHRYEFPGIYFVSLTHNGTRHERELVVSIPARHLAPSNDSGVEADENITAANATATTRGGFRQDPTALTAGTLLLGAGLAGAAVALKRWKARRVPDSTPPGDDPSPDEPQDSSQETPESRSWSPLPPEPGPTEGHPLAADAGMQSDPLDLQLDQPLPKGPVQATLAEFPKTDPAAGEPQASKEGFP